MSISELLALFDSDGMHLIDRGEFESAMQRQLVRPSNSEEVLMEIFDECDRDGRDASGMTSYTASSAAKTSVTTRSGTRAASRAT